MALTLIQSPNEICLARNQNIVKIRALGAGGVPYSARGANATLTMASSARFSVGGTLTVNFTPPGGVATSVVFTGATNYSADAALPVTGSGLPTSVAYWTAVRDKIAGHPQVGGALDVVLAYGTTVVITISLRDVLPAGVVTLANSMGYAVAANAATADTTPDNYAVLLDITAQKGYNSGDWVKVASLRGVPDADGYLSFDIGPVLSAHCRAWRVEPIVPVFGTDTLKIADNLRRYSIGYTEESGTPPTQGAWTYTSIKLALDGGVAATLASLGDYLMGIGNTNSLLSWMPSGRLVGMTQPEYLPWYNYTGIDAQVVVECVQYNVTTGVASAPAYLYTPANVPVKNHETLLIPANPTQMGVVSADTYKIVVRVVDKSSDYAGGSPRYFSPARTYYIDRDYYESERYIQYLNGFGCPECWRCTGLRGQKLAVSRSVALRSIAPGYNPYAFDSINYGNAGTTTITYRTGYMRQSEAYILQEMLLAPGVYDVTPDGYIALRLTANSFDVAETKRSLHAYTFTAEPRLELPLFSKIQVTESSVDYWQEPDGSNWQGPDLTPWEI